MMFAPDALWFVFSFAMVAGVVLWHPVEWIARRLAAKPWWCGILIAALPVFLRIALLPSHPEPTPSGADDFSYLLQADTFAHFRLANPPHPMHRFFETNFVLQEPHYNSVFAPGQGLFLAVGEIVTGHPWVGILLSEAALCGLCYWMLLGWVTPLWAFAGGLFAVSEFGPLSQWMNSYWGGAADGIAGCLIFGALPRLRAHSSLAAVALGAGLGLSWLTRPFETALAGIGVALYFAMVLRKIDARRLASISALVLGGVAPFAAFSLLHNHAVTGSWTTLPYTLSREQYGVPAAFTFQPNPVPRRHLTPEQELDYRIQSALHGDGPDTAARFVSRLAEQIPLYRFFFYPPLYLALLAFLASLREARFRWLLLVVLLFALGTNFYPYFYPHYVAALACVFVLMSVIGLVEIGKRQWRGRPVGREAVRLIVLLYGAWFVLLYGAQLSGNEQWMTTLAFYDPAHYINWGDAEGRAGINAQLARMPGEQLVFIHYGPRHGFHEWIFNAADIDRAKVVRALDLGDSENRLLIASYPRRTAWLLEPDAEPPRLTAYPREEEIPVHPIPQIERTPNRGKEQDSIPTLPESGFLKHRP